MARVSRWHSAVSASIFLVAAGIVVGSQALILAAIVPVTFLGYAAVSAVPAPETVLSADRQCTPKTPLPGEPVAVELTVRNESERTLPDVRVRDGVPEGLEVLEGREAATLSLSPGEERTLNYTLRPRRGSYTFEPVWLRLRSLSATAVGTVDLTAAGDDSLECRVPLDGLPLHRETIPFVGAVATDSGGPGYEFHSTREYRRGDPLNRINWRRYARSGELGTVRYREQEAASVVVIVDGRPPARVSPGAGHPDGITLSAYAGLLTTSALAAVGHEVGLVGLGVRGTVRGVYDGPPAYVEPGRGHTVGARIASVCDDVAAQSSAAARSEAATSHAPPAADGGIVSADRLDALFPPGSQLVCCTPAVDDAIVELTLELRRRGYPLSVVSPAVTTGETIGARVAALHRETRLERLQRVDGPVVDWDPETNLASALDHGMGVVQ